MPKHPYIIDAVESEKVRSNSLATKKGRRTDGPLSFFPSMHFSDER